MFGNIKRKFQPKTGLGEKQILQDPGYVKGVEGKCCMLHAKLYEYNIIPKEIKNNSNQYIRLHLRSLFVM